MMSENNKIGTYKFVAEPFHVDFTGSYWSLFKI
jgi:medium-chain acyl-[acyl-carrier-protein] hydrolase